MPTMLFKIETPEHQRTAIQSVVEEPLYTSFGLLVVTRRMHATFTEDPWSPLGGASELIRRSYGTHTEVYASDSVEGYSTIVARA